MNPTDTSILVTPFGPGQLPEVGHAHAGRTNPGRATSAPTGTGAPTNPDSDQIGDVD